MARGGAVSRDLVITLENMHEYMHLSITNFAAYALLLTNVGNPFEGKPLGVDVVRKGLESINGEVMARISKSGRIGSDSLRECAGDFIKGPEDYLIREEDFGVLVRLSTNCLMRYEAREFVRAFGGGAKEWIRFGSVELPLVKLALLGSAMTYVGRVFGGNHNSVYYLFLDIDPLLRGRVYGRVRGFLASLGGGGDEGDGGNNDGGRRKGRKRVVSPDDVSQIAKVVVPAALVLTGLGGEELVKSALKGGIVMHLVSDTGDAMFDLTRIAETIWRAGLAGHITLLAGAVRSGDKALLELLNDVSQAVFEAANTGDLLPIYRYVRSLVSLVGSGRVSGELGGKLIESLAPVGGLG